jgi:tRNA dimethylallyltransferase
MAPRIWLIAGPTASGKSALAVRLAREIGGEIINADSMQLYADIPILSAAPTQAEQQGVPHHLFGVADAADGWSAGRWLRAATTTLAEIHARGAPAIIVGGTGLYFSALVDGLAEIPEISPDHRRAAQADYDALGEPDFRDRLAAVDSAADARIAAFDRQRLVRAWSVYAATGKALTDWQAAGAPAITDFQPIALEPPRETLYARCDTRLGGMIEAGALAEVEALIARGLDPALPALKAVGVRELAAYLRGEAPLYAAIAAARQETRRYAKRQLTWMRGRMADWPRITAPDGDGQWADLFSICSCFFDVPPSES